MIVGTIAIGTISTILVQEHYANLAERTVAEAVSSAAALAAEIEFLIERCRTRKPSKEKAVRERRRIKEDPVKELEQKEKGVREHPQRSSEKTSQRIKEAAQREAEEALKNPPAPSGGGPAGGK